MKPTQQEIIELARDAGMTVLPDESLWWAVHQDELERFATLLLERFGAGGGEPVATVQRLAGRTPSIAYSQKRIEPLANGTKLYTHPSPTDLRAEYLRGLDDAARVAADDAHVVDGRGYYDQLGDAKLTAANIRNAIEALKGKQ